jgi:hypothetical protein
MWHDAGTRDERVDTYLDYTGRYPEYEHIFRIGNTSYLYALERKISSRDNSDHQIHLRAWLLGNDASNVLFTSCLETLS